MSKKKQTGVRAFMKRVFGRREQRRLERPRDIATGDIIIKRGGEERSASALPFVRGFARDLSRNNAYASRAVASLTSRHVGKGIRISMRGESDYESTFVKWANSSACDFEGRLNFYGLQSVMVRSMFETGDGIAVMREEILNGHLTLTIQLIDADQLDEAALPVIAGHTVRGGIEIDRSGRAVYYHIKEGLEDDLMLGANRTRPIHASDVIHIFEVMHPGQIRGIPRGSQAMTSIDHFDHFMMSARNKAYQESNITGIVTRSPGEDEEDSTSAKTAMGFEVSGQDGYIGSNVETDEYGRQVIMPTDTITPGTLISLPAGSDYTQIQTQAIIGLQDYMKVTLRAVSVSFRIPYWLISGDTDGMNFSVNKAITADFDRDVDSLRVHTIFPALHKIHDRFKSVYEADTMTDVNVEVHLTPPGRETMQPKEEADAMMTHLMAGGITWSDYCRERGLDPEDQIRELTLEKEKLAHLGLFFGGIPNVATTKPVDPDNPPPPLSSYDDPDALA